LIPLLAKTRDAIFAQIRNEITTGFRHSDPDVKDPIHAATNAYFDRMERQLGELYQPRQTGNVVSMTLLDRDTLDEAYAAALGLVIPAANASRISARRLQAMNNMKQIMLAKLNYLNAHEHFPQDICDEEGNPLLSWRVRI